MDRVDLSIRARRECQINVTKTVLLDELEVTVLVT